MPRTDNAKQSDSEDIFLAELMKQKAYWSSKVKVMEKAGLNPERERSYSEAYKMLINKFTQPGAYSNV